MKDKASTLTLHIGVQRSCHRVTSCNERARIDVEKSRRSEDDERKRESKGFRGKKNKDKEKMKKLGSVTRLKFSNDNRRSKITYCFQSEIMRILRLIAKLQLHRVKKKN